MQLGTHRQPLYTDKITEFEKSLKVLHSQLIAKHKYKKRTNLTPLQVKTLKELKTNKGITIKPTDKNLGLAVLDTSQYISQVLKEHLLTPTPQATISTGSYESN
jgi:hypothetical protein